MAGVHIFFILLNGFLAYIFYEDRNEFPLAFWMNVVAAWMNLVALYTTLG